MSILERSVNRRVSSRRKVGPGVMPEVYIYPGMRRRQIRRIPEEWMVITLALALALGIAGVSVMDTIAERRTAANHQTGLQAVNLSEQDVLVAPPSYNPRPTSVVGGVRLPATGSGPQG